MSQAAACSVARPEPHHCYVALMFVALQSLSQARRPSISRRSLSVEEPLLMLFAGRYCCELNRNLPKNKHEITLPTPAQHSAKSSKRFDDSPLLI